VIRNTPAQFEIGAQSYRHWFDGLAMLYSFTFENGAFPTAIALSSQKLGARTTKLGKFNFHNLAPIPVRVCSRDCLPHLKNVPLAAIQMSTLPARRSIVALTEEPWQWCLIGIRSKRLVFMTTKN
jgi:hypothetical protein